MTFEKIYQLLKTHRTVTLITADNAALIISFLFKAFKQNPNGFKTYVLSEKELTEQLTDYLYILNNTQTLFPRPAKQYLTEWSNAGYLRKYPAKNDEFSFELTPATENVFKWIDSLEKREFVGQESRLKQLFENLKELSTKSKRDYLSRIKELEQRKKQVEKEIEDVKNGKMDVLDDRQIKEQYFIIEDTAKNLLADFKQVEQNFRELDKHFRQKIITTTLVKGKVLEDLFEQQTNLLEQDQGRSFNAFWEFLLSHSKQEELENYINDVLSLPAVKEVQRETLNIANIRNDLIEAGDKTKRSTNSLLEQLRKYLEHKSFTENKRIYDNINEILRVITTNGSVDFSKLDFLRLESVVHIELIMAHDWTIRGFKPPQKIKFAGNQLEDGITTANSDSALFNQFAISMTELRDNIQNALKHKKHILFSDFIKEFEIKKGVAEVVAYIDLATNEKKHIISADDFEFIEILNSKTQKKFKLKIPKIIFCK